MKERGNYIEFDNCIINIDEISHLNKLYHVVHMTNRESFELTEYAFNKLTEVLHRNANIYLNYCTS